MILRRALALLPACLLRILGLIALEVPHGKPELIQFH